MLAQSCAQLLPYLLILRRCCYTEEKKFNIDRAVRSRGSLLTEQQKHTQSFMQRTVTEDVDGNSGKLLWKSTLIIPSKKS